MRNMEDTQVQKAYQLISDMIFRYQISPGMMVSDFALSKVLGISRTPIRQAIMMLLNSGLVVSAGKGYKVPEITLESIDDLYDARVCLEVAILRMSMAKGIDKADIARLRQIVELESKCNDSGDILSSLEHDLEFHKQLNSLSHNMRLESSFENLRLQMKMLNVFSLAAPNFSTPAVYSSILDSIAEGDVELATAKLANSIESGRRQKKTAIEKFGVYGLQGIYTFIAQSYSSAWAKERRK